MIATEQPIVDDTISNHDYHADLTHVGHSMLSVFRNSPVEYAARFVHKTMRAPDPTPSMCLGTAVHALVLEPERFDELVAIAPDCDRRTKNGKEEYAAFLGACNGRAVITADQNEAATRMAKSILSHPEAAKLLKQADHRESVVRWVNEPTGIRCKLKADLLWVGGSVIGDLKTAADPTPGPWARQAASLGYARQNAWYASGAEVVFGRPFRFLHVVVGNTEPFECCAYFMDAEDVEHAKFQNQRTLNAMRECMDTGEWSAVQNRQIKVVSLPKWTLYED